MRLPWLFLIFTLATLASAQDPYKTFAKNDAEIGEHSFTEPMPAIVQNLDILVDSVYKADKKSLPAVLKKFEQAAKGHDEGFATSFGWVAGEKVSAGSFTAVAVSYGPIGKVMLFESGHKVAGGMSLAYMVQRSPHILHLTDHELIVGSSFVRDAGIRDNTRVESFSIRLGRNTQADSLHPVKSFDVEHTLDWGGAHIKGGKLVVESIESPKSFILANPVPALQRRRTYRISYGDLKLERDEPGDLALRAVDEWLAAAQQATRPNAEQAKARKIMPEPELLSGYVVTDNMVRLEGDAGTLVFRLVSLGKGYAVGSVSVK